MVLVVLFSFCIFGTAMFAEPSVTEIEEVVGLMHLERSVQSSGGSVHLNSLAHMIGNQSEISFEISRTSAPRLRRHR